MVPALYLAVLSVVPPAVRAAGLENEVHALKGQNAQLLHQVHGLRADLAALAVLVDPAKLAADVRRERELAGLLGPKADPAAQKEWAEVRQRLRLYAAGGRLTEVMIKAGVLKDGLSRTEAEALLGPPTHEQGDVVEWYHNGRDGGPRRHVAPYVRAAVTKDGLSGWKTGLR